MEYFGYIPLLALVFFGLYGMYKFTARSSSHSKPAIQIPPNDENQQKTSSGLGRSEYPVNVERAEQVLAELRNNARQPQGGGQLPSDGRSVTYRTPEARIRAWEDSLILLWRGRAPIVFDYVNRKQESTRREVVLEKVKMNPEGEIYLYGFCMLRQERRNFKAERIDDTITNLVTGEVMEIVDYLISLGIDAPTAAAGVEW